MDRYEREKTGPLNWYNKAADLRAAAGVLWASFDEKRSAKSVDELGLGQGFSIRVGTVDVYLMLFGMALELLYKAILVAKDNQTEVPPTHDLAELAKLADVQVDASERNLLKILSESIIWDGRYPIPVPKQRQQMDVLHKSRNAYLREKHSGNLKDVICLENVLCLEGAFGWQTLNKLWDKASEAYWKTYESNLAEKIRQ